LFFFLPKVHGEDFLYSDAAFFLKRRICQEDFIQYSAATLKVRVTSFHLQNVHQKDTAQDVQFRPKHLCAAISWRLAKEEEILLEV